MLIDSLFPLWDPKKQTIRDKIAVGGHQARLSLAVNDTRPRLLPPFFLMAQTISDCPRPASPATKTPGTEDM